MNRKFRDELISAYLDGELTAEEQTLVEEQLMDSVEHRKMFEELRALRASLQSMPLHKLDDKFHERVLRRAERAMLSGDADGSDQDSGGEAPSRQSEDADKAAPTGDTPAGDTLVQPVKRADSRRPSRRLLWTSLAVIAGMLLIGVLIVFPPGLEQIAENQSPPQEPDATSAPQPDAEELSQSNVDQLPASEAFANSESRDGDMDKRLPLGEKQQSGGGQSSRNAPSTSANDDTAGGAGKMLRKSAGRDLKQFGVEGLRRQQRALSAVEQAAPPVETRIVRVVMSEDAYQRGLFDEELAKNQIAVDRSTDLAAHRNLLEASPEQAKDKVEADAGANYEVLDRFDREAGTFEVVMVDADPLQIESVVAGLNSLPGQQVATSVYRQSSAYGDGENKQVADYAATAQQGAAESDGVESNGAVDSFSFAPGGNRAAAGESRMFRGGGFGGGGSGAGPPADRTNKPTPATLSDNVLPGAKSTPQGDAEPKDDARPKANAAQLDAPAKPGAAPARDPASALRRGKEKADAEPVADALPKPTADLDARREAAERDEAAGASVKRPVAGAAAPAPVSPQAPTPPPADEEADALRPELPAAPVLSMQNAARPAGPKPADPQPVAGDRQDRLGFGTARRLNEQEVKELTAALGRLERVDQARHAAMQSVMEKAASVVGDLESAEEEAALNDGEKSEAEALKKGSDGASPASAAKKQQSPSASTPRPAAEPRNQKAPEEKTDGTRGLKRETRPPSAEAKSGSSKRRFVDRKAEKSIRPGGRARAAEGDEAERPEVLREQKEAVIGGEGESGQGRMRVLFVIEVRRNHVPAAATRASKAPTEAAPTPAAPASK